MSARCVAAGLSSGPRMLNTVRTPSAFRTGTTFFMAGWNPGANMKQMPAWPRQFSTPAGGRAIFMPSSSSTSALPHCDDTDRLPCFATLVPHAATTTDAHVEKLTVWWPSPPVPTMSTHGPGPGLTVTIWERIAVTMPATSPGVSPLALSSARKAAVWQGSHPAMMLRQPDSASARDKSRRSMRASRSGLSEGASAAICFSETWSGLGSAGSRDGGARLREILHRRTPEAAGGGSVVFGACGALVSCARCCLCRACKPAAPERRRRCR